MSETQVMTIFPRPLVWDEILDPAKILNSSNHISKNIAKQDLKFVHEFPQDFGSNGFFLAYEPS